MQVCEKKESIKTRVKSKECEKMKRTDKRKEEKRR